MVLARTEVELSQHRALQINKTSIFQHMLPASHSRAGNRVIKTMMMTIGINIDGYMVALTGQ